VTQPPQPADPTPRTSSTAEMAAAPPSPPTGPTASEQPHEEPAAPPATTAGSPAWSTTERPTRVFGAPAPPPAPYAPVAAQPQPTTAEDGAQSGSPADFVPGFAEAGTPTPTPPPSPSPSPSPSRSYGPRERAALAGVVLVVLCVLLLQLGLGLRLGTESLWSVIPLWSAFATVAALLGLLAFVPDALDRSKLRPRAGWKVAAGGLVGLTVFWLLVVLPVAGTDRGFLLTAALVSLGGAVWIAPSREDA
jgi:hypothetical protein